MIIVLFLFPGFNDVNIYNLFLYLFSESCAFNPVVKLTGLANLGLVTKTMILLHAVYLHNLTMLFFKWGGGGDQKKSVHGPGPLQEVHVLSSPFFCCLCYCTGAKSVNKEFQQ